MADANPSGVPRKRGRPATTPEDQEKKLQNMAYDLAEQQLQSGKISSQIQALLMKGGSQREQLELERLKNENRLLNARIDGLESAVRLEALMGEALDAFRSYQGTSDNDDVD